MSGGKEGVYGLSFTVINLEAAKRVKVGTNDDTIREWVFLSVAANPDELAVCE
jgi:hypothetical protein